jgi:hypothetical protein
MPRNRVIYQSEALFAAPTGSRILTSANNNLRRVQSCNYNFAIQRQDINQYGELAAIDRLIIQEPTVSVDMSYYFEPIGFNEQNLGLKVNTYASELAATGASTTADHMLQNIIAGGASYDQKNIFVLVSDAGVDANDTGASAMANSGNFNGIIGIGNAFLTSWSLDAAVGAIPTVSCAFEGQNINFTGWGYDIFQNLMVSGASGDAYGGAAQILNPSIVDGAEIYDPADSGRYVILPSGAGLFDPGTQVSAVRPGDITVILSGNGNDSKPVVGFLESDLKVQSVNFALSLGREPIRKLGSLFAFAREITFPINCTMSVSAIVGDTVAQRLFSLINGAGDIKYNCAAKLTGYKAGSTNANISYVVLKGAKIDSQNVTSSIGPNKAVTIELSAQIGKNSGLHMYGSTPS